MPSYDPLNQLTIAELDTCSRLLKTDIVAAIHGGTMNRWAGMAILAYVIAKRTDPAAKLGTFREMTPVELTAALGYPEADVVDDDVEPEAPHEHDSADEPLSGWVIEPDDAENSVSANESAGDAIELAPATPAEGWDAIRGQVAADPTAPTRA